MIRSNSSITNYLKTTPTPSFKRENRKYISTSISLHQPPILKSELKYKRLSTDCPTKVIKAKPHLRRNRSTNLDKLLTNLKTEILEISHNIINTSSHNQDNEITSKNLKLSSSPSFLNFSGISPNFYKYNSNANSRRNLLKEKLEISTTMPNKAYCSYIDNKEKEINELKERNKVLEKRLNNSNSIIPELVQKVSFFENKYKEIKNKNSLYSKSEVEGYIEQIREKNKELVKKDVEIKNNLESYRRNINALVEENNLLKKINEENSNNNIHVSSNRVFTLKSENRDQVDNNTNTVTDEYKDKYLALLEEKNKTENLILEKKDEISQLKKTVADLTTKLSLKKDEFSFLMFKNEQNFSFLTKEKPINLPMQMSSDRNKEMNKTIERLKKEKNDLNASLTLLKQEKEKCSNEIILLSSKINSIESSHKIQISELENENKNLGEKLKIMTEQNLSNKNIISTLQKETEEKGNEIEKLKKCLEDLNKANDEMIKESNQAALDQALLSLQKRIEEKEKELLSLKEENNKLLSENNLLKRTQEINNSDKKYDDEDFESLQTTIMNLKEIITEKEKEIQSLKSTNVLTADTDSIASPKLKCANCEKAKKKIDYYKNQLQCEIEQNTFLKKEIKNLTQQNNDLSEENKNLKTQFEDVIIE